MTRALGRFDYHHEFHGHISFSWLGAGSPHGLGPDKRPGSVDTTNEALRNRQGPDEPLADVRVAASRAPRSACCSHTGRSVLVGFVYLSKLAFTLTYYLEEILDHF